MFVDFFIFSYSDIIIEREVLMQKYIHLVQIVETEKVAANQLRTQLEDQDTEIERLKSEVQHACVHTLERSSRFPSYQTQFSCMASTFSEIAILCYCIQ